MPFLGRQARRPRWSKAAQLLHGAEANGLTEEAGGGAKPFGGRAGKERRLRQN